MQSRDIRKTTAVGSNAVQPTAYQIRSGHFVIPAKFYEAHKHELAWKQSFDVVAFGTRYSAKKIDDDRRLYIRLRENVTSGDTISLDIRAGLLHVERSV